uniref:Uncharacterized protein n=1 Tax=Plectus sambesii TaxID=2011161 RepID=A0A914UL24_9BILA
MTWGWKQQSEEKNKKSCQPSETTVSEADEGVSTDTDERQEFDQNGSKWTTCCGCHVATLTFVWGTVCMLVAILIGIYLVVLLLTLSRPTPSMSISHKSSSASRVHGPTNMLLKRKRLHYFHDDNSLSWASSTRSSWFIDAMTDIGGFNPCARKYRTCCCHVKTFTIVAAVMELGLTCLGLLRNTVRGAEMCGASEERRPQMEQQYHKEEYKKPNDRSGNFSTLTVKESTYWDNYGIVTMIVCSMLQSQIFWSIVEIVTVVMLLYGIKARRWGFLVPHLILQGLFLLGVALGFLAASIFTLYFFISINGDSHVMSAEQIRTIMIIFSLVLGAVLALFIYIFVCTIRCCQFVKEVANAGILSTANPSNLLPMVTVSHGNTFTAPQYPYPQQNLPALKLAQEPPPAYATIASAPPSTKAD